MFPGFFLSFLYLVYIVGWALINPKVAPKLPEAETKVPVPDWVGQVQQAYSQNMTLSALAAMVRPGPMLAISHEGKRFTYLTVLRNALAVLFPALLTIGTFWGTYWYVVVHQQDDATPQASVAKQAKPVAAPVAKAKDAAPAKEAAPAEDKPEELGGSFKESDAVTKDEGLQEMGTPE